MAQRAARFGTRVENGQVYVDTPDGELRVGELAQAVELAGGPAWTIEYSEWFRRRHPEVPTSDEGLVVDVADMTAAMTHDRRFVETLAAQSPEPREDGVSPRMGLFVGKLLDNLQFGVD